MLDHAAGEIVKLFGNLHQVFVVITDLHPFGTHHVAVDAGDGEAALGVGDLLFALFQNFRIDEGAAEVFQVRIGVRNHISVYDDHTLAHPDLRGGKAAAIGLDQRVLEVLHQVGNPFLVFQIGRLGGLAQYRCAVEVNGFDHT